MYNNSVHLIHNATKVSAAVHSFSDTQQLTRDGLIYLGLLVSIVVIIFTGAVVSVQVYRRQSEKL